MQVTIFRGEVVKKYPKANRCPRGSSMGVPHPTPPNRSGQWVAPDLSHELEKQSTHH